MLLDHNFNMTNVYDILFYWVSQSEECNQKLQNLTKLAGKKYSFKTLKQKKVVFMKKYHFKAVFEKKQARTYTVVGSRLLIGVVGLKWVREDLRASLPPPET